MQPDRVQAPTGVLELSTCIENGGEGGVVVTGRELLEEADIRVVEVGRRGGSNYSGNLEREIPNKDDEHNIGQTVVS